MRRPLAVGLTIWTLLAVLGCVGGSRSVAADVKESAPRSVDSLRVDSALVDSLRTDSTSLETENADASRYERLTESDFAKVAAELDVEIAAIKAVVVIEAGKHLKGFWAPGVPMANFDRSMYNRFRTKVKGGDPNAKVPAGLKGYALKEWTQLTNARRVNSPAANMGTFWGMFQIGGFNYKKCECATIDEFVAKMSESEFQQLELFAAFIRNTGMLADLKAKRWSAFARKYNGASYAKRGYHRRMAEAYARYKK